MSNEWRVNPGIGASGGGGPFAGAAGNYQITKPDGGAISAYFYGGGVTAGGPASLTYSDSDTPSYGGKLIWRPGVARNVRSLGFPSDGMVFSLGTAPRLLTQYFGFPYDVNSISGGYLMVLAFGVNSQPLTIINPAAWASEASAWAMIALDIKFEANGTLLGHNAVAYAAVASAAKGADLGGVTHLSGRWTLFGD